MTSRERFLKAVNHEEADRVPTFEFPMMKEIWRDTIGMEPAYKSKELFTLALIMELDCITLVSSPASTWELELIRENVYKDEWGQLYQMGPAAWPINAPIPPFVLNEPGDLKTCPNPDPDLPERYEDMKKAVEMNRGRVALGGVVNGPLTMAWYNSGAENILYNVYDNPQFLKDMFRFYNDYWIQNGLHQIETGVDFMWIAEDLGHSTGPFFSPKMFRDLLLPYLDEMVQSFKKVTNIPIGLHCCGAFQLYIDDLIDLGFVLIHPFQRTAGWDIKQVKEEYGDKICIVGNVDSSNTLPYGTPEDVKKEVKEIIRVAGKGGGLIVGSDHSIHDGIPMENFWAIGEAVREYGSYPLNL
jgi:uroporphyrinogen decarboxylase